MPNSENASVTAFTSHTDCGDSTRFLGIWHCYYICRMCENELK